MRATNWLDGGEGVQDLSDAWERLALTVAVMGLCQNGFKAISRRYCPGQIQE